jgi:hypothetical protein
VKIEFLLYLTWPAYMLDIRHWQCTALFFSVFFLDIPSYSDKSVKIFKNSQQIDYATYHGNSYADRERNSPSFFFLRISQMRNVSTFGNTADIYAIVHLVPHARQHLLNAIFAYCCLVAANRQLCARAFPFKKTSRVSHSIGVRITMIRCLVCLLLIF